MNNSQKTPIASPKRPNEEIKSPVKATTMDYQLGFASGSI